ncbi:DNA polymerase I [Paenibacillus sp. y28]|uniref:DNA polymerase I n=1 Tax=Paenibacillus sp. y28 TaxID=3129110 RepID=UPI003016F970
MSKLLLFDGNSLAYRAFFALPPLTNSSGLHTNAVYGFTTMLLRLLEEEKPTHVMVAFDAGKTTFRHEGYEQYKAGREKTPSELSEQFPLLRELLTGFGITHFELPGYEADDIIGTVSRQAEEQGAEVLVVSGDKDMLQLASPRVTVAVTRKGISEVERYGPEQIQEKYGLKPEQIIDLKGLMGDASDNIPGVPGVGEKTALKLLHEHGSVEEVLARVEDMKGKLQENLRSHAEDARMSKRLATIYREVPIGKELDELAYSGYEGSSLGPVLRKLEFKSLMERLELSGAAGAGPEDGQAAPEGAPAPPFRLVGEAELDELEAVLSRVETVYLEATGDNPHHALVSGLAFYTEEACYYLPFALVEAGKAEFVKLWLEDERKAKQVYDLHKMIVALAWNGIQVRGVRADVMLAAYLLDPTESGLSLHALTDKYSLPRVAHEEDVYGKGARFQVPPLEKLAEFASRKADAVHRLIPLLAGQLEEKEMNHLYYDLELPLAGVLSTLELRGITVDGAELREYGEKLAEDLATLTREVYALAGTEFNIGSPKQLGEVLFEKLGLPPDKKTKTGYSTGAEVLEKLEPYHPVISKILHYRQVSKLQSTYVEGLLKEIRPQTGKVHTYYQQTIAATGRLSSQFPNLQNIPIRLEEGRRIRKVFKPSQPGWRILAADYSQIELRVLAHISGDEKLKEAFVHDLDIHTKTAMDVFGVTADQVDSNMRRQAKAVNFGIVYGISGFGLSVNLNISVKEAERFKEQYFAVFQGVQRYMEEIVKEAREAGYVTTLLHRRRYLPEIKASNFNLRSFAERTAMNTPIQGTAADIIKLAMVQMAARLSEEKLQSRMLLQVHDELVFEVPEEELDLMRRIVPEVMENAIKLDVPLKVDASDGSNWYEAK